MQPEELLVSSGAARRAWCERSVMAAAMPSIANRLHRRMCRRPVLVLRPWPQALKDQITQCLQRHGHTLHMLVSASPSGRRFVVKAMVTTATWTLKPSSFDALQHEDWTPLTYLVEWPQPSVRRARP